MAWKTDEGPRLGDMDLGPRGRNPDPGAGSWKTKAGVISSWNIFFPTHTNQLCLTLIDPDTHNDSIPIKKSQTLSRRINDPGIIAACHCEVKYETHYSASIETHTAISIDSVHQISIDRRHGESVDSRPDDWENDYYNPAIAAYTRQNLPTEEYDEDYEEERATDYRAIINAENKLLHHSSWKRMYHRSTKQAHHRSILNLIEGPGNEHRPTLPTTNRSTLTSTVLEKETTRLAVRQTNTTTKALQ